MMTGEEFNIHLIQDTKPFCINTPRSILFVYRDKLKTELELLQQQNIIAPITEATEWCAHIVVTPKKNIHMCVDLSHLNRYIQQERYMSPTPAEAITDIAAANAKYFTVLDAIKGYHQCPLDQDSQLLTTFITPLAGSSTYVPLMGYLPSLNITIAAWQKPWQTCRDFTE